MEPELPPTAKVLRSAECGCVLYEGRWKRLSARWCEGHPYAEGSALNRERADGRTEGERWYN